MPDLGIAQTVFNRVHDGILVMLRAWRMLAEDHSKLTRERIQVRNENDTTSATPQITACVLDGSTIDFRNNTTIDGKLVPRFVANGGNWDVALYKATGGGGSDKMCQATNVAAGATGTLVEANSSKIAGTITLGAAVAAQTTDKHRLRIEPDLKHQLKVAFPQDGLVDQDLFSRNTCEDALDDAAADVKAAMDKIRDGLALMLLGNGDTKGIGNDVLEAFERQLYLETTSTNDGTVSLVRSGIIERLRVVQRDDTTAGAQTTLYRNPSAGSAVFDGDGVGTLTVSVGDRCPAGRFLLKCKSGVNDGVIGDEVFEAVYSVEEGGDKRDEVLDDVTVLKPFTLKHGIQGQVGRTYSKVTTDGSNTAAAAASFFTFDMDQISLNNTDVGKLYGEVEQTAPGVFTFNFYSSSARDAGSLVAKAEGVTANALFTASAIDTNGVLGLDVNGKAGSAPADNDTFTISCQPFYSENSDEEQDSIEVPVTVASTKGLIGTALSRATGGQMNTTNGTPTLKDELLQAGCFPPYLALDN